MKYNNIVGMVHIEKFVAKDNDKMIVIFKP